MVNPVSFLFLLIDKFIKKDYMKKIDYSNKGNKTVLSILIGAFLITGSLYLVIFSGDYNHQEESNDVIGTERQEESSQERKESMEETELDKKPIEDDEDLSEIIDCLEKNDVVVYGSETCPACASLAASFGGYEKMGDLYVECMEDVDRCNEEKVTGFVPEIQIDGSLYEGSRDINILAREVGCEI